MKEGSPEVMPLALPTHLLRAVLKPICQCHVRVGEIHSIHPSGFRGHGVLLGKDQAHDLAELDILKEELYVYRVWRVLGRNVDLIFNEVVLRQHPNVRIIGIDANGAAERDSHRSVPCKQGPPDPLP